MEQVRGLKEEHIQCALFLAFSHEIQLLASVGGHGSQQELMVWNWRKGRRIAHHLAFAGKVEEVEFNPGTTGRLVTVGHRHVRFWKLRGNVLQASSGIFAGAAQDDQLSVSHLPEGLVVTGTSGGHLYIWLKEKMERSINDVHPGGVLATEIYPGGLITGGRDGTIKLFDRKLNHLSTIPEAPSLVYEKAGPVHSLSVWKEKVLVGTEYNEIWCVTLHHSGDLAANCLVQGHGQGELWGLATHPTRHLAITAGDDQSV
ncbi:unnamed protein product, partial [Meganyctiphanes norvegica]